MNQATEPQTPPIPRYFVAIPLSEAQGPLARLQPAAVAGVRLVGADEFHLTLHFLGRLPPGADQAVVCRALAALTAVQFEIAIKGVGRFPPQGQAQVLWAGVEPCAPLLALHRSMGAALADAFGFQTETRPYLPHVTLARLETPAAAEGIDDFLDKRAHRELPLGLVRQFVLYSSTFNGGVPSYVQEAEFPLRRS